MHPSHLVTEVREMAVDPPPPQEEDAIEIWPLGEGEDLISHREKLNERIREIRTPPGWLYDRNATFIEFIAEKYPASGLGRPVTWRPVLDLSTFYRQLHDISSIESRKNDAPFLAPFGDWFLERDFFSQVLIQFKEGYDRVENVPHYVIVMKVRLERWRRVTEAGLPLVDDFLSSKYDARQLRRSHYKYLVWRIKILERKLTRKRELLTRRRRGGERARAIEEEMRDIEQQIASFQDFVEKTGLRWDKDSRYGWVTVDRIDAFTDAQIYRQQKQITEEALIEVLTEMNILIGSLKLISAIIDKIVFGQMSYGDAVNQARAEFEAKVHAM
jgi:hypothetical protein